LELGYLRFGFFENGVLVANAFQIILKWEGFYNSRRRHSGFGYRRPNEVHYVVPQVKMLAKVAL